jgi:hypothetical protein
MSAMLKATWSDTPGNQTARLYCSPAVTACARPGMRVYGSKQHNVAVGVQSTVSRDSVGDRIPEREHKVIRPAAIEQDLQTHVIAPTLRREAGPCLVIATGPTSIGKTTVMRDCVREIAELNGGELAYLNLPPGNFRRSYYGESEHMVRELFATAIELGQERELPVFIAIEDSEVLVQSRRWSQQQLGSCSDTTAATTAEFLHGIDRMAKDARIAVTIWMSSNYESQIDPALTSPHRLRKHLRFPALEWSMVPAIVRAHTEQHEVAEESVSWLIEALEDDVVLARGRRDGVAVDVSLSDVITPGIISGIVNDASLRAERGGVELGHLVDAWSDQMEGLANRIVDHSSSGDIAMLVPALRGAGSVQLTAVFDPSDHAAEVLEQSTAIAVPV